VPFCAGKLLSMTAMAFSDRFFAWVSTLALQSLIDRLGRC
jgi:hypothetical protein